MAKLDEGFGGVTHVAPPALTLPVQMERVSQPWGGGYLLFYGSELGCFKPCLV